MYSIFIYNILWILDKICKFLSIAIIYENNKGIKCLNKPQILNKTCILKKDNEVTLTHNDLFLGFDYLDDEHTLLNTPITLSPHFIFLSCVYNGEELTNTDYIERVREGYLDFRRARPVSKKDIIKHKEVFSKRIAEITRDTYEPITIYTVNGRAYIADGKHRAALCALLKKPIKCVKIEMLDMSPDFQNRIYNRMKKNHKRFKKNIKLIEDAKSAVS